MSSVSPRIPAALATLVEYLDSLDERAPLEELQQRLSTLAVTMDDLTPFAHFGSTYRRNLISEGAHYELLCICWRSGQRSPIHDHAHSTCGLRVIQGVATETVFENSPCGQVKAVSSSDLAAPLVVGSQDDQMHQVSNLQASGDDLVTLHIYSPPLRKMDTYSIMGPEVSIYCPETFEVSYGAGI